MSKRFNSKRPNRKPRFKSNKRRGSKRGPTTKALAKKVRHIENDLMELKWFDYAFGPTAIPVAGQVLEGHLLITQGDSVNTRTGNIINPTSLMVKLHLNPDVDNANATRIRIVAFWDRQVNGVTPTLVSVNNGVLDNTTITDTTITPRNYNTIDRYKIFYDKMITFNPILAETVTLAGAVTTTTTVISLEKTVMKNWKLNRKLKYDANTGAMTDLVSNGVFVALFSDQAVNTPTVTGGIRMYYRDS